MKKRMYVLVLLLVTLMGIAYGGEIEALEYMIRHEMRYRMAERSPQVQNELAKYSPSERQIIYDGLSITPFRPMVINATVGFGLGSFIRHDSLGGAVQLVGDAGGVLLLMLGISHSIDENVSPTTNGSGDIMIVTGISVFLVSRLFGILRPIRPSIQYNKKLKALIGLEDLDYSVRPQISPDGQGQKLALQLSLSY